MDPEDALIGQILADPDDEAAHLVYADWLVERDRPAQAELVRIRAARRHIPEWDPRRVGLQVRERRLRAAGAHERLLAGLPRLASVRWLAHDGVQPVALLGSFEGLVEHQEALRPLAVGEIRVPGPRTPDEASRLAPLAGLGRLSIFGSALPEAPLWLVGCRALDSVTELELPGSLTAAGVRALFDAPFAGRLVSLGLTASERGFDWPDFVETVLPSLRQLRSLQLAHGGTDDASNVLDALWASPHLGGLREIQLRNCTLSRFPTEPGASSVRLDSLVLDHMWRNEPDVFEQIGSAASTRALRSLRVRGPYDGQSADRSEVRALVRSGRLQDLQRLDLTTEITVDEALRVLGEARFERLHRLEVRGTTLLRTAGRRDGLRSILDGPSGSQLRALGLRLRHSAQPVDLPRDLAEHLLGRPTIELIDVQLGEGLTDHPTVQRLLATGGLSPHLVAS